MILTISRAEHFSPNSVAKDAAILECLGDRLRRFGFEVETVSEDCLSEDVRAEAYVSMSRSQRAKAILRHLRDKGAIVIAPSIDAKALTSRKELEKLLAERGLPVGSERADGGYWVKRNIGYTEREDDIVYAPDREEMRKAVEKMAGRFGKDGVYVSGHIEGDLVKFYGVEGTGFFKIFYPGDDGESKFLHELRNGKPKHYHFDVESLRDKMDSLAHDEGITFYGGDCIVNSDGKTYVIDLNDWPSYSRCREEASMAMAKTVMRKLAERRLKDRGRSIKDGTIKGLILDYGGTLDTGGDHWGKVIWKEFRKLDLGVDEATFREAYVYAERQLGRNPIIKPDDTFKSTLSKKLDIELSYIENLKNGFRASDYHDVLLGRLYSEVLRQTARSRSVLADIKRETGLRMALVSNFYGNVNTVLEEFGFNGLFESVIESAIVGVRKPDPAIFAIGVKALGIRPEETLVVGDSYEKDILPSLSIGCQTVWFMGEGWTDVIPEGADAQEIITDISALRQVCNRACYYKFSKE